MVLDFSDGSSVCEVETVCSAVDGSINVETVGCSPSLSLMTKIYSVCTPDKSGAISCA